MRIGTFRCWLFGHKFVLRSFRDELVDGGPMIRREVHIQRTDYCVRCGAREDK